jgi:OOP family OmpA-OmpF porin
MRSETRFVVTTLAALAVAALSGCASHEAKVACHPVAGWATPVFLCESPPAPVVATPPPAPTPPPAAPEPEPEPEPKQTAEVRNESIELSETVQFETDSAVLLGRSRTLLDEVVKAMKDHPEVRRVLIEGYTDAKASRTYNQKLSEERAAAVKTYLVEHGVEAGRLRTKGFGERKPVGSNKTEEGREKNRRVVFRIVDRKR